VQVPGAEKILYGLDDVAGESEVIIVEGEMDRLAMMEAGITNVVSVPDGAPSRVRDGDIPAQEHDTKFSYLWNCRGALRPPRGHNKSCRRSGSLCERSATAGTVCRGAGWGDTHRAGNRQ